ncbi:hypothetical protein L0337_37070, partial [candidate division KSB1 bacterium]|nr:hypothetical protein [candidate division KSB1 bacterium]
LSSLIKGAVNHIKAKRVLPLKLTSLWQFNLAKTRIYVLHQYVLRQAQSQVVHIFAAELFGLFTVK